MDGDGPNGEGEGGGRQDREYAVVACRWHSSEFEDLAAAAAAAAAAARTLYVSCLHGSNLQAPSPLLVCPFVVAAAMITD